MKDESTQKEGKYTESSLANQGGKKSNKCFILGRLFRYQNVSSGLQPGPRQLKSHPPQLLFSVVITFFSCPGTKAPSLDTTAQVTKHLLSGSLVSMTYLHASLCFWMVNTPICVC